MEWLVLPAVRTVLLTAEFRSCVILYAPLAGLRQHCAIPVKSITEGGFHSFYLSLFTFYLLLVFSNHFLHFLTLFDNFCPEKAVLFYFPC